MCRQALAVASAETPAKVGGAAIEFAPAPGQGARRDAGPIFRGAAHPR
jgi:hypothetical protein